VSFSGPMFAFAVAALVCLVVVLQRLPPSEIPTYPSFEPERTGRTSPLQFSLWRNPKVAPFLWYGFLVGSAQAVNGYTLGFLVIDKVHMTPAQAQGFIQVAMMGGAIAGLMAQWGLIRIFHMKPNHLMLWGAGLAGLGNLFITFAPNYGAVVTAYALASVGFGFARPGFTAGASLAAPPGGQGDVAGAITAVNGSCIIITPILGVWLYDHLHWAPFAINTILLAAMAGVVLTNRELIDSGRTPDARVEAEVMDPAQVGLGETPRPAMSPTGAISRLGRRLRAVRRLEARRRQAQRPP
jgi:MFS family permease